MLKEKVDILAPDWRGNNVIQSMITLVFFHPNRERKIVEICNFVMSSVERNFATH